MAKFRALWHAGGELVASPTAVQCRFQSLTDVQFAAQRRDNALAIEQLSTPQRSQSRQDIDLLLGSVLDGDFEVVRRIGAGSHADVYQGKQKSVGQRTVALKVLHRHYLQLPEADYRRAATGLQREADLLGNLHAACFVDVYRAGQVADGRPYIALEFAEGATLGATLADKKRLELSQLLDLVHQWAEGLGELHARGWVHRDITPNNAVLGKSVFGTTRLMIYDFGTATQITGRADRFKVGFDRDRPQGTAAYMSPEQAAGGIVDGRSDQFSLACIVYEALTGQRAFVGHTPSAAAVLNYLRGTEPIPSASLASLRPELPPEVGQTVHRALRRDPEQRHDSIVTFAQELEKASQAQGMEPTQTGIVGRLFSRFK